MKRRGIYSKIIFLTFIFLNVYSSLNMEVRNLKSYIHIKNIAVEGNVSQISYIGPGFISRKSRKNIRKNK